MFWLDRTLELRAKNSAFFDFPAGVDLAQKPATLGKPNVMLAGLDSWLLFGWVISEYNSYTSF